ncbi:MAG: phage virion morphogenesis protein [Verrucomicrobia bacterium]|nr:phage virion morphogenesis protein [Verrucomicrobiota bacterium]
MSLSYQDRITPKLLALARGIADRRPILAAMGQKLRDYIVESFTNPALRIATWDNKKDGKSSVLFKSGQLKKGIHVSSVTNDAVTVSTLDLPYAWIHQFGGTTRAHVIEALNKRALAWPGGAHPVRRVNHPGSKIPPRPYFPITPDGRMLRANWTIANVARAKILSLLRK